MRYLPGGSGQGNGGVGITLPVHDGQALAFENSRKHKQMQTNKSIKEMGGKTQAMHL